MQKIRRFMVLPSLPERLGDLQWIAHNMSWSWNSDCVDLFRRIDPRIWESSGHNPVKLLGAVTQARLEDLAENDGFLCELGRARERLTARLETTSWFDKVYGRETKPIIAYFSAEFGIHECLPIYAGGLGILAGDHLKSASDLGVPIVGVGLLYQKGYFRQYLNTDGWQQEQYTENDFYNMPVQLVRGEDGRPLTIKVTYPGRTVQAFLWRANVGRVQLYLLDTNMPGNSAADRLISSALYAGDSETRIQQEIMLGIGGINALSALGIEPTVCHLNEGHAAFAVLERIRRLQEKQNIPFQEAAEAVSASTVFTIHTPVRAGNEEFSPELMDKYFEQYFPRLGISRERFLGLGRLDADDEKEAFKMTVLGLRLSTHRNAVSQLHGQVSRKMWASLWPDLPAEEIPIDAITNGVHARSWISGEMNSLFERYLGSRWADEIMDKSVWRNVEQIPDEEFWRIHQRCKERLVGFARKRLKAQLQRRGSYHTELGWAEEALDPEALTIGFGRRFATYKRGNLLLKDPERLLRILTDRQRPVQIIFAGKAHPRDGEAKEIIRQIIHFTINHKVRHRLVFLEDYDIAIARHMVQGCDVWLNNPRRPMEASGTSGMKAALNGALNLSTFDGWWCEGYQPDGGWIIGAGESYDDQAYQDMVESQALYNLLENEVVPLFFARGGGNLPRAWMRRMKNSIAYIAPRFNTHRMLAEYTRKFYNSAGVRWEELTASDLAAAKALAAWKKRLRQGWAEIEIADVTVELCNNGSCEAVDTVEPQLQVGSHLRIKALIKLGEIQPDEVAPQVYHGPVDAWGNIHSGSATPMSYESSVDNNGHHTFVGTIPCRSSGQHGFAVRVLPRHQALADPYDLGLIKWEGPAPVSSTVRQ